MVTADRGRRGGIGGGLLPRAGQLILAALVWAQPAAAALVCRAEVNRTSVPRGDEVVLTVSAEGDAGWSAEFQLPDLPGVQIAGGGTNQSMSYVNGVRQASISRTYYLRVDRAEDFTIGPVLVTSSGRECRTEPLAIRVLPPDAGVPPADSGNRMMRSDPAAGAPPAAAPGGAGGGPGDDLFVELVVDRDEVWAGQQVILRFRYYRRIQPWNNPQYTPPRTEGFWREDLGPERNFRATVQGRAFNVTEIRYALFPTRSGRLTIEPAELRFPDDVFDRFFSSRRRSGPRLLKTDPVVVTVRDLPSPRPADFSGLVATQAVLTAKVDRDSVPRGEPVALEVSLLSDGFLKGFTGLRVTPPAGVRLHEAGESFGTQLQEDRLTGVIRMEKVLVPQQEGGLDLEPATLTWFDAGRGEYRTLRAPRRHLEVLPSDLPLDPQDDSGFLRSEISRLGQDLAFIHPVPASLSLATAPLVERPWWWFLFLLPGAGLLAWRLWLLRLASQRRDPAGRRRRRALAEARRRLRELPGASAEGARHEGLSRAITGFVADLEDRPPAAVGAPEIREFCRSRELPAVGDELTGLLAAVEAARYGGAEAGDPAAREARALALLTELATAARRAQRPGGGTRLGLWLAVGLLTVGGAPARADEARTGPDPLRLVAEGNQAYTAGDLETALARYLEARERGVDDAVLHFNLGNTYARRGELGRSVASYLRARRLTPRDRDVAANLGWVRGQIKDLELSGGRLPLFIAQAAALVGALTLGEWSVLLLGLLWLLAAGIAWGWYREEFAPALRRSLLAVAGLVLLVGAIAGWRWYREEVVRQATVVVAQASVRSGPDESFPVLFEVHDGLTVHLEVERDRWYRIGLGGDWVGWLPAAALEPVRPPQGR